MLPEATFAAALSRFRPGRTALFDATFNRVIDQRKAVR